MNEQIPWMQRVCIELEKWKALHRIVGLGAAVVLSRAFLIEAEDRTLDWMDFISYPIGMGICYSATALNKIIQAGTDWASRKKGD